MKALIVNLGLTPLNHFLPSVKGLLNGQIKHVSSCVLSKEAFYVFANNGGEAGSVIFKEHDNVMLERDEIPVFEDLEAYSEKTKTVDLTIFNLNCLSAFFEGNAEGLFNLLKHTHSAVLLLGSQVFARHIILYYDGNASSVKAIENFAHLFPQVTLHANTCLISPLYFRKALRDNERKLVIQAGRLFAKLGFIKLPLFSVPELLEYGIKSKTDFLVLGRDAKQELANQVTLPNGKFVHNQIANSIFIGQK